MLCFAVHAFLFGGVKIFEIRTATPELHPQGFAGTGYLAADFCWSGYDLACYEVSLWIWNARERWGEETGTITSILDPGG